MKVIVSGVKFKKELRLAAHDFNEHREVGPVLFQDPSLFQPIFAGDHFNFNNVFKGSFSFACTNHPKRSWFAQVSVVNGKVKVS